MRNLQGEAQPPQAKQAPEVTIPGPEELFALARTGGRVAIMNALNLPHKRVVAVVGKLGFDPQRRARNWKDTQKIKDFVADELLARLDRNRQLLPASYREPIPVKSAAPELPEPSTPETQAHQTLPGSSSETPTDPPQNV